MSDTLSPNLCRTLFSEKQWDLIYAMVGHALDDDEFDPHDVYSIRNKIHSFFEKNDWNLQLHWRYCDSSRTDRCYLHWYHRGAMLYSLLQFSSQKMTYKDLISQIQQLSEDQQNREVLLYNFAEDLLLDNEVTALRKAQYDVPGEISEGTPYLVF